MQGGGQDRQWYEPLAPDGSRDLDTAEETLGCHGGPYSGLNVGRPQPGFVYAWARNDPRDLLRARHNGSQVVNGDDPEYSMFQELGDDYNTPLDTSQLYKDVVLVRTPIERVRERREAEARKSEMQARGDAQDFLDRASDLEAEYGGRGDKAGPTRFVGSGHTIQYEEDGKPAAAWSPATGVVRR
jgi:hypothetical protein